jgi:hypothetical protein
MVDLTFRRAAERDLGEIGAPEAGRRVDHDHRAGGQRHRDDPRLHAEAQAQDQERHQRDHRGRDQQQDVGGYDLLDERELRDHRGEQEADRSADGEAEEEIRTWMQELSLRSSVPLQLW